MEKITVTIEVPDGDKCGECLQLAINDDDEVFCGIFNKYTDSHLPKLPECIAAKICGK